MMFVIAAVFILVISFVIALVSLIKEQSKIEKEIVAFGKNDGLHKAEKFQAESQHVPEPGSAILNVPQPQPPSQDFNVLPLAEKPWWEREIQKWNGRPQNHIVQEENIVNTKQQQGSEVPFVQAPSQVLQQEKSEDQTPQDEGQNLQGSFSVADLADKNQES